MSDLTLEVQTRTRAVVTFYRQTDAGWERIGSAPLSAVATSVVRDFLRLSTDGRLRPEDYRDVVLEIAARRFNRPDLLLLPAGGFGTYGSMARHCLSLPEVKAP